MKVVMKIFAWLLIIWGSLGIAANASTLYLSMRSDVQTNVVMGSGDSLGNDSELFVVIVFHLFLIIAGLAIKNKASN